MKQYSKEKRTATSRSEGDQGWGSLTQTLGQLYRRAAKGDESAAKRLFRIASEATRHLEALFQVNPDLVTLVSRKADEFPILYSWSLSKNQERQVAAQKLDLGSSLPLKTNRVRDASYRYLQEELIWSIGLDPRTAKLPLLRTRKDCRAWARAIVDARYPAPERRGALLSTIFVYQEDLKLATADHYRKRRSRGNAVEIDETEAEMWMRKHREKMTISDFRSGLIDSITSRLWNGRCAKTLGILEEFRKRSRLLTAVG